MAKTTKAKAKKTTTSTKVTKKPTTVKRTISKKRTSAASSQAPFMQPKFTQESLYWIIFGAVAILFAMWIYTLDAKVRDLYDQIDANTYSTDAAMELQLLKEKAKQTSETTTE